MNAAAAPADERDLRAEIARLESQLSTARNKLYTLTSTAPPPVTKSKPPPSFSAPTPTPSHALLLLADSALPLGSFAFSAGLESYLAHNRLSSSTTFTSTPRSSTSTSSAAAAAASANCTFPHFLALSLHAVATTSLPYLAVAHGRPRLLARVDVALDAATLCPVARRASVAQGRALLTAWERAFRDARLADADPATATATATAEKGINDGGAREALRHLSAAMRRSTRAKSILHDDDNDDDDDDDDDEEWFAHLAAPQGHFPPLWAVVTRAAGLSAAESAYVFLLGHAKAVASACVRAGVMGPYQAQALLASAWLKAEIRRAMEGGWRVGRADERVGWWGERGEEVEVEEGGEEERKWMRGVEEAGQGVPAMDLWIGRHELLYSRIFNS